MVRLDEVRSSDRAFRVDHEVASLGSSEGKWAYRSMGLISFWMVCGPSGPMLCSRP